MLLFLYFACHRKKKGILIICLDLYFIYYVSMRKILLFFITVAVATSVLHASQWNPVVAVVVDQITHSKLSAEIDLYLNAIREEGKGTVLIIDRWQHPDSIRAALKHEYLNNHLEGAILIGNIPVAMVRDAQHLTTAFKMDQTRDRKESSVPSDRIYDDFDLSFDYLSQDPDSTLYHYYSLRADSPQYIACDIYSSRIKAPAIPGMTPCEAIGAFLTKAVLQKQQAAKMNDILHFAGHGYNSESFSARIDEGWTLKEHFPFLGKKPGAKLHFINFDSDPFIKTRLLGALAEKDLDLAILHHHGSEYAQLLNGNPNTSVASQYIDYAKMFFRDKIRSARDTVKTKAYYLENYDITENWFKGWNDPVITQEDSLFSASMDINIPDLYGFRAGAKVILLDACFNGSFHLNDYIAGYYPFNKDSRTLVVKANSVNTLQDTWTNELAGLLNAGVCVGNWAKGQMTLESHLIGDATFHFSNEYPGSNLDRDIVKEKHNNKFWRSMLKNTYPEFRALGIKMLTANKAVSPEDLLDLESTDESPVVRLQAFMSHMRYADSYLPQAIIRGLEDSYELLRRMAALYAAKNGSPRLMGTVVSTFINPTTPSRVAFQLNYGMNQYPAGELIECIEQIYALNPYYPSGERMEKIKESILANAENQKKEFMALADSTENRKNKVFTIKAQRNLCQPQYLEQMIAMLENCEDTEMRVLIAETLGWYTHSYRKDYIVEQCRKIAAGEKEAVVKLELEKTIKRLNKNI